MSASKPAWEVKYMSDYAAQLTSGPVTFTPEQRKMNLQLLERLRPLMPCEDEHKLNDCDLLYRFLIGKHWDINVAEQFFRDYVAMRTEKKIQGIVGEKMMPVLEETMSPTFGTSLDGLAILWISPDPEKLVAAVKSSSSEDVIRTQLRVMEMTRLAQLHSGKDRTLCVIDLAKISMSTMNSTVMSFIRSLCKVLQDYYPEVFRRLVVYNTGWAVTGIWKVLKPFVDVRVQDKIKFFNTAPTVKSLAEYIAADQVLPRYGGSNPSNAVSRLIEAEITRIRTAPTPTTVGEPPLPVEEPAKAAPAQGTTSSVSSPTGRAPIIIVSSDFSSSATSGQGRADRSGTSFEHESPRLLDVEAEASLYDDVHESQLFTMRADSGSSTVEDDIDRPPATHKVGEDHCRSGALMSEDARVPVSSPTYQPHHNLSVLTAGASLPGELGTMRGLSAVYDEPTVSMLDDIDSCDLHSIDSASDDYDHLAESLSTFAPEPPASAGHVDTVYASDLQGSTKTTAFTSAHILASGTGSVPPSRSLSTDITAASPTRHADPSMRATNTATNTTTTTSAEVAQPTQTASPPFPSTVQIDLTVRGDKTISGYIENKLIAECRKAHILSTQPPQITTPTGITSASTVKPYDDPKGGSGHYVVGQLLVESGHPVHEFVLVCDAQRHARFIVRKSRFRSRLTIFQVIGDATVATDERGQHYIEGERVRLAVGVPHTNGVESDWMLYGEDLSSSARARRRVRGLASGFRSDKEKDEEALGSSGRANHQLLAECHGQTARFFGILASTHPLALFTLLVAVDRMWNHDISTLQDEDEAKKITVEKIIVEEPRDVVRSVKAFFRSGGRRGGGSGDDGDSCRSSPTMAPRTNPDDAANEGSANRMSSPNSTGGARRFFKKLAGKE